MRTTINRLTHCLRFMTRSVVTVGLVAVAAGAHAGLVGLSSGNSGHLYTIDANTGAATGGPSIGLPSSLVGLEYLGGSLYATDVRDGSYKFGSIDPATGAFTAINTQDGSANWHALAANESSQLFYTVDLNGGNRLKTVTTAGLITDVGASVSVSGMAYDDTHGILYAVNFAGRLYRIDTATGAALLIGEMGLNGNFGLAYDEVLGTLYANGSGVNALYTVDVTTGQASLVGLNGPLLTGDGSIDGLAWIADAVQEVPEPGSLALVGVALLALSGMRARRRS